MPFWNVTVADFGVVFVDVNDDDDDIIWHLFDVFNNYYFNDFFSPRAETVLTSESAILLPTR